MTTLQQLQQELKALSEKVEKALSEQPSPTIQPFEGTKRVRITGCKRDYIWYSELIGQEFDVVYRDDKTYSVFHESKSLSGNGIDACDCIEVDYKFDFNSLPQITPKQPWERYPDYQSCVTSDDGYLIALAKYARAVMILSTVAKKWNEGVGIKGTIYFPKKISSGFACDTWINGGSTSDTLPFYFHSEELCAKSIELFPQEWEDFFNAKNG